MNGVPDPSTVSGLEKFADEGRRTRSRGRTGAHAYDQRGGGKVNVYRKSERKKKSYEPRTRGKQIDAGHSSAVVG